MRYHVIVESRDANDAATRAMQWADGALRVVHLPERARQEVHLALDEVLANIAHYAYEPGAVRRIWLTITRDAGAVRVVVSDVGSPFNPLRHVRVPESMPLADRPVGGLGIYLTTRAVDDIRYRRRDGRNTLTLVKKVP